jgi:hypothetical protein
MKLAVKTTLAITVLLGAAMSTLAAEPTIQVGQSIAEAEGVTVLEETRAEGGSAWRVGNDFQVFLAPDLPRGELHRELMQEPEDKKADKPGHVTCVVGLGFPYLVKVGQIKSIKYTWRTPKPASIVNLSLRIYTAIDSDRTLETNDGPFYQRRLISEPVYVNHYREQFPDNRWGAASTDHPVSPLLWYDIPHTPPGFNSAPTLAQLQNGSYDHTWRDFIPEGKNSAPVDSYAYGDSVVKYISVMSYHNEGAWTGFKGDLDSVRVELTTGEVRVVDFGKADGTTAPEGNGGLVSWSAIFLVGFGAAVFVVEKKRRKAEAAQIAAV